MASCKACGSTLTTYDYQTRAADEAHTTVTTCPNCPVNAAKLGRHMSVPLPPPRFTAPKRTKAASVDAGNYRFKGTYTSIVLEVPKHHPYRELKLGLSHTGRYVSVSCSMYSVPRVGLSVTAGPYDGTVTVDIAETPVGMQAKTLALHTFQPKPSTQHQAQVVLGSYVEVDLTCGSRTYVYRSCNKSDVNLSVVVVSRKSGPDGGYAQVLHTLYTRGLCPESLHGCISRDTVARLSNLSPRAWDIKVAPSSGYVATCKPDGERRWWILSGVCWYSVDVRKNKNIRGWMCTPAGQGYPESAVVLDCEYMGVHASVLTDMLTDYTGSFAPDVRSVSWVLEQYSLLASTYDIVPALVRDYFPSVQHATAYGRSTGIPCDGVVVIPDGSTSARKVKDVKAIELRVGASNTLQTEDLKDFSTVPACASHFPIGTIVELRVIVSAAGTGVKVIEVFERVDKENANSSGAVHTVLESMSARPSRGENERRSALLWCNTLRKRIVDSVCAMRSNKSIVLDAGTGTGQSLDSLTSVEHTSFVLVEPDTARCESLVRRLNLKSYDSHPEQVISKVRSLKSRATRFCVVNCTLEELWQSVQLRELLFPELRAITCTFSIHFMLDTLQDIIEHCGTPVYGCAYAYDNVQIGSKLVDTCGVTMVRTTEAECEVTWGKDKTYTEPYTITSDYSTLGSVQYAWNVVGFPANEQAAVVSEICGQVVCVSPRRLPL